MIKYILSILFLFLIGCDDDFHLCTSTNNNPFPYPECECDEYLECEDGYTCSDNECVLIED